MKTNTFFRLAATIFGAVCSIALVILISCQKEKISPAIQNENIAVVENVSNDSLTSSKGIVLKSGLIEYQVTPKFGRPNATNYYFQVYDPIGTLALCVKLYNKATGATTYLPMIRSGNFWVLSTKISENGWYDYRYVYLSNYAPINNNAPYSLCNTRNTFSATGISSISWPFGADGSSWNNRTVNGQTWKGGQECREQGGSNCAFGWNVGTHVGTAEKFSDDWNRGVGSQDLGAIIRSPLDGYIAGFGTYSTSLGPSKYVAIIQEAPDGKLYRFYVGHLQSYPSNLFVGKYVRAGIDQIGTLGMSGASSPHAHTNMRVNGVSVPFYFNAQ